MKKNNIRMKKIVFIIPWFGPFRKDFSFWLKSVEHNPSVDFLMPTDQTIVAPPKNLRVIKTNLAFVENLAKKMYGKDVLFPSHIKCVIIKWLMGRCSKNISKIMIFGDTVMQI